MTDYNNVWEMHARDKMAVGEIARELNMERGEVKRRIIFCWKMGKCCNWHYDKGYEARHVLDG